MARSIDEIQQLIISDVQADPVLSGLTSTSKFAIWRLWTRIFATACNLLENIIDIFKSDTEATLAISAAASPLWIQAKMFLFQYSATSSQVIQLVNTVPVYPVVDPTLNIITRCSVKTDLANNVLVKLAQQEPPIALDSLMLASAQSYINTIGPAGIDFLVQSANADQLYIDADIYFNGQYRATIQNDVITAINNYLQTFDTVNFDGTLFMSSIETVIRSVTGVVDVVLNNVKARAATTAFSAGTFLIQANAVISRQWPTIAGYIITETTAGETLNDSLNFIAQ